MCFGLAFRAGSDVQTYSARIRFRPERDWVRIRSVQQACFGMLLAAKQLSDPSAAVDFGAAKFTPGDQDPETEG